MLNLLPELNLYILLEIYEKKIGRSGKFLFELNLLDILNLSVPIIGS